MERRLGALRNGALAVAQDLPPPLTKRRRRLGSGYESDRRFVRVLAVVLSDGLGAVEAAVAEALKSGVPGVDAGECARLPLVLLDELRYVPLA